MKPPGQASFARFTFLQDVASVAQCCMMGYTHHHTMNQHPLSYNECIRVYRTQCKQHQRMLTGLCRFLYGFVPTHRKALHRQMEMRRRPWRHYFSSPCRCPQFKPFGPYCHFLEDSRPFFILRQPSIFPFTWVCWCLTMEGTTYTVHTVNLPAMGQELREDQDGLG